MTNTDTNKGAAPAAPPNTYPQPTLVQIGQIVPMPAEVASIWSHAIVWIGVVATVIPILLSILIQLKDVQGLPENVLGWITSAISFLTVASIVLLKLFGTPTVTPTMAQKVLNTTK